MAVELTMPALSPTMESATLSKWLVKEGDIVKSGDLLAEIETEKVMMEFAAPTAGRVTRIMVAAGTDDVPVGSVIALLEDAAAAGDTPWQLAYIQAVTSPPAPSPMGSATENPRETELPAPASDVDASQLARCIASAREIDLSAIKGSGVSGRVVKADLGLPKREKLSGGIPPFAAATAPLFAAPSGVPYKATKLTNMRKTIARRLTESKQTIPHFYLSVDIRVDELLKARNDINASSEGQYAKISINDFMIKALATALVNTPDANVQYAGDHLYHFERVDISMAVAVPGGLVTPLITDAGAKSLRQIAAEARHLAERARQGKLPAEAYEGGTVSISNLGMYGIKEMAPVINPPQSLILGIGSVNEMPYSLEGQLVSASVMTVTASIDHRAIDGTIGAMFLRRFKELVEHPYRTLA